MPNVNDIRVDWIDDKFKEIVIQDGVEPPIFLNWLEARTIAWVLIGMTQALADQGKLEITEEP